MAENLLGSIEMKVGLNLLLWTAAVQEEDLHLLDQAVAWGAEGVEFSIYSHDASPWEKLGAACDERGLGRNRRTIADSTSGLARTARDDRKERTGKRFSARSALCGFLNRSGAVAGSPGGGPRQPGTEHGDDPHLYQDYLQRSEPQRHRDSGE